MRPCNLTVGSACVLLAGCSLLFFGGCASVEGVWIAEGFSCRCLRDDGLVVGGVASAVSEPDQAEEVLRAALLRDKLEEGGGGLLARDVEELVLHLGTERHAGLMEEYRSDGTISPESLAEIAECGVGDRYLLLARITRNEVKESKKSEYDPDAEERTYTKSTMR